MEQILNQFKNSYILIVVVHTTKEGKIMKKKLGQRNVLYPMPVTVVGTLIEGKPNFINIAHVGILNAAPPHLISLGMSKTHYSNQGIRMNKTLSINMVSRSQMTAADYVGLVSGTRTDKSDVFEVFYGELENAPMIVSSPMCMECRLVDVYDAGTHEVFIVEVVQSYADESVLTDGKPDLEKVDPLLFDMSGPWYWGLGDKAGKPWSEGKAWKK